MESSILWRDTTVGAASRQMRVTRPPGLKVSSPVDRISGPKALAPERRFHSSQSRQGISRNRSDVGGATTNGASAANTNSVGDATTNVASGANTNRVGDATTSDASAANTNSVGDANTSGASGANTSGASAASTASARPSLRNRLRWWGLL
jgi:hypothetical protein